MKVNTSMLMSRRILARARPRRRARVRRSAARLWKLSLLVAVASLVGAASASADTVFSDGFESGDFSAWSQVQTNVDGTAAVQGTTVSTGSFAAQLSESATAGSKAYARKTLASTQQDLSASGDFRVVAQGIAGQNVPFFRFLDPTSARVVSIYRQNGTFGRIYVNYGGSFFATTGSIPLDTWGTISLHVITNGLASTVEARLNGTLIYQTTSASLGTAGIQTVQIGNDTGSQAFTILADTISVHTPPNTTIDSGPSGTTNDPTPSFGFSSSEPGSSFECRIDSSQVIDWQACSSPKSYGPLADGPHSFEVRATDSTGSTDATPASRSFTVDATAPETTIDSGPSGTTNDPTPSFGFSSSEPGSSFECKVDAGAYAPCSSPLTTGALADGSHSFSVRATDSAGNTDATPASRSFTVDATAPETTIDSGPSGTTTDPTPSFGFSSSEPGSSFECKVDAGAYAPCSSPLTTGALADGSHSFSVRATDSAGNTDATPASRSFTVDATAPETTIDSGPSGTTTDPTPSFGFSSSKPGSSFSCKVDSGPYAPCQSPYTTSHLTDGSHSFSVRAKDAVGNTDLTPASRSFKIDTTAPDLVISSRRVKMRGGAAKVKLTCPAKEISGPCEGTLKLKTATRVKVGSHRRKVTLGSADYSIPAGKVARVEVELSKQSRKLVNALGKVRAKATTAVSDAVGNEGKVKQEFDLIAPR